MPGYSRRRVGGTSTSRRSRSRCTRERHGAPGLCRTRLFWPSGPPTPRRVTPDSRADGRNGATRCTPVLRAPSPVPRTRRTHVPKTLLAPPVLPCRPRRRSAHPSTRHHRRRVGDHPLCSSRSAGRHRGAAAGVAEGRIRTDRGTTLATNLDDTLPVSETSATSSVAPDLLFRWVTRFHGYGRDR